MDKQNVIHTNNVIKSRYITQITLKTSRIKHAKGHPRYNSIHKIH